MALEMSAGGIGRGDAELALRLIAWSGPQLVIRWAVDEHEFTTTLRYGSVDWDALERSVGADVVRTLAFHIAMFEINKGVSFGPTRLTIPPEWRDLLTTELVTLWTAVVDKAWAQWRFDHDRPMSRAPAVDWSAPRSRGPIASAPPRARTLWFCGGGKDSLLTSHLLSTADVSYDALVYSHSVYGPSRVQMDLLDDLVASTDTTATHRIFMDDTCMTTEPGVLAAYGTRYVLAAETPASVFAALPVAVAHGFDRLVVGHERSANAANLTWPTTGEQINHQWGKSFDAEQRLHHYVQRHLVEGLRYFSALQPIADPVVFASLPPVADRLPLAHSCNVSKPWCLRCAKCAYVWLSYHAWLPADAVRSVFGETNLLDIEETQLHYRRMLGLEDHTPFECIGQVDEVRLAFSLARARGVRGRAMAHFDEVGPIDFEHLRADLLCVDRTAHLIPDDLGVSLMASFRHAAADGLAFVRSTLGATC